MKTRLFCYVVIVLLLYSCANRGGTTIDKQASVSTDSVESIVDEASPFTPIVEKAIEELIDYIENEEIWEVDLVYSIVFFKERNNVFIGTGADPFYLKDDIIGYTYFNDRMVVYYGDTIIGNSYIDVEKLKLYNDTLPGFLDYDDMPEAIYEPFGILYQIISSDSLLMIRKGMQ